MKKHGDNYLEKAFIICSGLDMVNIHATHVVCKEVTTAETWKKGLRSLTNNVKINNICPMKSLEKHHKRIRCTVTVDGKVGVKTIAKTFASGKTEKLVYQTLADCGLPNGKDDSMDGEAFTFDIFYKEYHLHPCAQKIIPFYEGLEFRDYSSDLPSNLSEDRH